MTETKWQRTELAAVSSDVEWTWTANECATQWMTLSAVDAWITSTVVFICIHAKALK